MLGFLFKLADGLAGALKSILTLLVSIVALLSFIPIFLLDLLGWVVALAVLSFSKNRNKIKDALEAPHSEKPAWFSFSGFYFAADLVAWTIEGTYPLSNGRVHRAFGESYVSSKTSFFDGWDSQAGFLAAVGVPSVVYSVFSWLTMFAIGLNIVWIGLTLLFLAILANVNYSKVLKVATHENQEQKFR